MNHLFLLSLLGEAWRLEKIKSTLASRNFPVNQLIDSSSNYVGAIALSHPLMSAFVVILDLCAFLKTLSHLR